MNMTSIDVTDVPGASRGDVVTLMSREPSDPNSVLSMAKAAGTTPYVILAHIPGHLNRIVDQVLDFARRTEPALEAVNVNQLLDDLTLLTRHKLKSQNVALIRRLDRDLPQPA